MDKKGIFNLTIAVLLLVIVPAVVLREYQILKPKKTNYETPVVSNQEYHSYAKSREKEFVFIVFSMDGESFSSQNLHSIFTQQYSKYRIVFFNIGDDVTPLREAKLYVEEQDERARVKFIQCNDLDDFAVRYAQALNNCRDEEVVVQMDGRDWLANTHILERLNEVYEDPDVWLTYGEYLEYPTYKKGRTRQVRSTKQASIPWTLSRFKTFYAGLYKELHIESEETVPPEDSAFLLPMVEMAKWHVRFIPDVLYIRSATAHSETAIVGKEVSFCDDFRRADCLIFSENTPEALGRVLGSIKENLFDISTMTVMFSADEEMLPEYRLLQARNPRICFHAVQKGVREELCHALGKAESDYALLLSDKCALNGAVFSAKYINAMEKAGARALFFGKHKECVTAVRLDDELFVKPLKGEEGAQEMSLYKKELLLDHIARNRFKSLSRFIDSLGQVEREEEIALFLEESPLGAF